MLKTLFFATHNRNKSSEIAALLREEYIVKNLYDLDFTEDIPETGTTLKENAAIKARFLHGKTGMACFADDTGLEVEALEGKPGVYSARYAGPLANAEANMDKLLGAMREKENRQAVFRTVIAYIDEYSTEYYFEGEVKGQILYEKRGSKGFGYDPVFKPEESNLTFAEMNAADKGRISHRARALQKFINFLKS